MSDYNYKIWCEITFAHEYWNESNPQLFNIIPTDGTREFITRNTLLLRQEGNKFFVLAPVDWLARNSSTDVLEFKVESLDPYLINYTQSENFTAEKLTTYELGENTISVEQARIVKSLYFNLTDSVSGLENASKTDILKEIIYPKGHELFQRSLDASDEGKYKLQGLEEVILYEKNGQKNKMAWLLLRADKKQKNQYKIDLKCNEVFLKYRVTSRKHNVADITIEAAGSNSRDQIEFARSIEEDEAIFLSNTAIKWREKSEHSFRLMNGKKKPLIENLSSATHKNLRFTDNHQPYLEIFIHL